MLTIKKQPKDTALTRLERTTRKVEDFTEGGKKCLERLEKQIEARLPAPTATESLATLLDPALKKFARQLLGESLYAKTVDLLKAEHLSSLNILDLN